MTTLTWDSVGEKKFEAGVDRGVLYLADGSGVPWNGLTAVIEAFNAGTAQPLYFEGVKYGEIVATSDFTGTIKAYTYPPEFGEYEGVQEPEPGFYVTGQSPKRFGLSWRTRVGNDITQIAGYKIHILRNVLALPVTRNNNTINDSPEMMEFEWSLSAIPSRLVGYKPTAHLVFDSTRLSEDIFNTLQDILYGTESEAAYLPPLEEIMLLLD